MNYTKRRADASFRNFLLQVSLFQDQDHDFCERQSWICGLCSGMVNHMQLRRLPGQLMCPAAVAKIMD
jgi:hypothetical protein